MTFIFVLFLCETRTAYGGGKEGWLTQHYLTLKIIIPGKFNDYFVCYIFDNLDFLINRCHFYWAAKSAEKKVIFEELQLTGWNWIQWKWSQW